MVRAHVVEKNAQFFCPCVPLLPLSDRKPSLKQQPIVRCQGKIGTYTYCHGLLCDCCNYVFNAVKHTSLKGLFLLASCILHPTTAGLVFTFRSTCCIRISTRSQIVTYYLLADRLLLVARCSLPFAQSSRTPSPPTSP